MARLQLLRLAGALALLAGLLALRRAAAGAERQDHIPASRAARDGRTVCARHPPPLNRSGTLPSATAGRPWLRIGATGFSCPERGGAAGAACRAARPHSRLPRLLRGRPSRRVDRGAQPLADRRSAAARACSSWPAARTGRRSASPRCSGRGRRRAAAGWRDERPLRRAAGARQRRGRGADRSLPGALRAARRRRAGVADGRDNHRAQAVYDRVGGERSIAG